MSSSTKRQPRHRKMTEEGRLYNLELYQKNRQKLEGKIVMQLLKMEAMLEDGDRNALKGEFPMLDDLL